MILNNFLISFLFISLTFCSFLPVCVYAEESSKVRQVFVRDQLAAFNARTLTELLNALPGISANGGIKIQGSSSSNVVVLIDGRRITDSATKVNNIGGYFAKDIEQIEVIKGAGAAIYGDDTAGGVILITTRKGKKGISGSIEVFTDTYRKSQIMAKIAQQGASCGKGGTLKLSYADQPQNYPDWWDIVVKNIFWDKTLNNGAQWMVNFDGLYGVYNLPGLTYAPTPSAELKGYDWNLTTIFKKDLFKSQTYYTGYGDNYENPDTNFHHKYLSQVVGETINYSLDFPIIGQTPVGGTVEQHIITSNNFDTEKESQGHLFATKDWELAEWVNLAVGFRLSYYTAFDWGYNPEITLTFPLDKWIVKANANQSCNTPSIHNRFYNTTYTKGNPDLDLEKVRNFSLGLAWNPMETLGLSANGFYNRIDDAVTQVRYGDITTYENLATTTRKGGEVSMDLKPWEMANLNLSYVYLLAKNDDTDLYLIEKPQHTFKYTMNIKWNDFALIHKGEYTSSYYSDSANSIEIPGRYIGDIRVERSWRDWLVYLDVTNFLDKNYEKYYGKPGNERVFRLGVQRDF
ncbi:MAG: TonB-dependent receptor plug domain-containing protein [Deltaproteobacteria bacterium]|nr:TonB-dependent receptor plug domain-containing protein [Deltaproteobacteria bacterium]